MQDCLKLLAVKVQFGTKDTVVHASMYNLKFQGQVNDCVSWSRKGGLLPCWRLYLVRTTQHFNAHERCIKLIQTFIIDGFFLGFALFSLCLFSTSVQTVILFDIITAAPDGLALYLPPVGQNIPPSLRGFLCVIEIWPILSIADVVHVTSKFCLCILSWNCETMIWYSADIELVAKLELMVSVSTIHVLQLTLVTFRAVSILACGIKSNVCFSVELTLHNVRSQFAA